MIRTLIIEDKSVIRRDLERLLSRHTDVVLLGQGGTLAETRILLRTTQPDLVLFDIHLSDGNSFSLLKELESIPFDIVFVTAFDEYALKAIKAGAIDYLLKPIDEAELATALAQVRQKRMFQHPTDTTKQVQIVNQVLRGSLDLLTLRTHDAIYFIPIDDIIYAQAEGNYTNFLLKDDRRVMVSHALKEYEQLLSVRLFIRPHQSYLVNIRWVDHFQKVDLMLILRTGHRIPVSHRKRDMMMKL